MIKKHKVVGVLSPGQPSISPTADETLTNIPLADSNGNIVHGIGNTIAELKAIGVYPSDIGLDLLILAELVFAADTRLSRATESQDSWTRQIKLVVPVSNVSQWIAASPLIVRMLNFLTGDLWAIEFINRPGLFTQIMPNRPRNVAIPHFDKAQLFSGGLDSLIGAINNVVSGNSPLFISHAGDAATSDAQHKCFERLQSVFGTPPLSRLRFWLNIDVSAFNNISTENTTRGRSFLFFAIGIFAGTGFGKPFTLEAPENGLIALNVPLDYLRLGALSTHTTHTFYIKSWNELLQAVGIQGQIVNPYWDKTKGEMVSSCLNQQVLQQIIPDSLSCSSPAKGRWIGHGIEHCGYCLPCIIRRASLKDQSILDTTTYRLADLYGTPINTNLADGQQIRSFQVAINRLLTKPELSKLLIHKSGPMPRNSSELTSLGDVYLRGMQEVGRLLENVTTEPIDG